MSISDEMKRLQEDMAANDELRLNLEKKIYDKVLTKSGENDADIFIKAAADLGYRITLSDLERSKAEAEALDPDELEQVAGGKEKGYQTCWADYNCFSMYHTPNEDSRGHSDGLCYTLWYCLVVSMHNDSDRTDHACWKDYECGYINN